LIGGTGLDTASYRGGTGPIRAILADATQNGGDAAGDIYKSIENLEGSDHADLLAGDANQNVLRGPGSNGDLLDGGDGEDLLVGGRGSDWLKGGAGRFGRPAFGGRALARAASSRAGRASRSCGRRSLTRAVARVGDGWIGRGAAARAA
jgi:hypothetical protein